LAICDQWLPGETFNVVVAPGIQAPKLGRLRHFPEIAMEFWLHQNVSIGFVEVWVF
jgi:hypothetical protein